MRRRSGYARGKAASAAFLSYEAHVARRSDDRTCADAIGPGRLLARPLAEEASKTDRPDTKGLKRVSMLVVGLLLANKP